MRHTFMHTASNTDKESDTVTTLTVTINGIVLAECGLLPVQIYDVLKKKVFMCENTPQTNIVYTSYVRPSILVARTTSMQRFSIG